MFAGVDINDPFLQLVAIKRLFPHVVDAGKMWAHEFSHHWTMHDAFSGPHPHIVQVLDAFRYGGGYYTVMEWCHGSVADLFDRPGGYHGEDWFMPVATGLLGGLDWIHFTGHVHGDITTDNVLFQRRRGPFSDLTLAELLSGPGLYTFKVTDFSYGDRWFEAKNGQDAPERKRVDIEGAAHVLIDVAHGRAGASQEDNALDGVPERYRETIRRARAGEADFAQERIALDLLTELIAATGP